MGRARGRAVVNRTTGHHRHHRHHRHHHHHHQATSILYHIRSVPFLARSKTFHFGNAAFDDTRGFSDARVLSDPRGASASPGRHVADLAHHACITYGRPVDARRPTTFAGRSARLRPRRRQPAQLR